MWAAYEKEGVKPKQDWREADATGTMQRCVRGGLVRIRMRKEREAELRAQEREKGQASSAERGGDDDLGDASGGKAGGGNAGGGKAGGGRGGGGGGWRDRAAADDFVAANATPLNVTWEKLHVCLDAAIREDDDDGDRAMSLADREKLLVVRRPAHPIPSEFRARCFVSPLLTVLSRVCSGVL